MLPVPPPTVSIVHAGEVVAVCTSERVYPAAVIAAMPSDHPDRALVEAKCLIAGGILRGELKGPYDDAVTEEAAAQLVGRPNEPRT